MALREAKHIDQKTKNLVFGHIRLSNNELNIPMPIYYLCLLYYYLIPDKFIICDDGLNISSSNKNDKEMKDMINIPIRKDCWMMAHGNMIINTSANPDAIVSWTIQNSIKSFCVGIHNFNSEGIYFWNREDYEKSRNCKDDLIKMELNVRRKKLSFYKNGKLRKVCSNLTDAEYRLAVRVHGWFSLNKGSGNAKLICTITGHKSLSFHDNRYTVNHKMDTSDADSINMIDFTVENAE